MIITILGLAVVVISTYFVYKTAKDYGRNAALWAIGTACLGLGCQWILPFIIFIVMTFIYMATGISNSLDLQSRIIEWAFAVTIGCLLLSGVAMWFMLKKVSVLSDEPVINAPPPPPSFT